LVLSDTNVSTIFSRASLAVMYDFSAVMWLCAHAGRAKKKPGGFRAGLNLVLAAEGENKLWA